MSTLPDTPQKTENLWTQSDAKKTNTRPKGREFVSFSAAC
jgi:hypothetical protein